MEKAENCQSESDSDTEFFDAAEESPCMPPCQDKNKSGIISDEESALQVSKNEHEGLQLNLVQHFNDTVAQQDNEQKSLEREHLEKVKNSNCGFLSATGTLSPITECDPVEQFARENEAIELSVRSHSSEDVENELSPSTTGADQMKSKECKTIDNEDVLHGELGTKSDLDVKCIDVGVISLDKPVNNKLSLEEDTPPPVAPPRRKRKKKQNTNNSGEEVSPLSRNAPSSVEDNHSSEPVQEQSKAEQVKVIGKEKRVITDSFDSIDGRPKLQSDPSIELDGDTQEMNRVLVKTNSTEVVSSLILDSRLKSPSVSSLCRSDLSDSYASVASNLSNGHIRRSGSLTSVGSTHSHAGHVSNLVRVRSASGRPLSDTEILEQVMVRNLDTGELVPLSVAEEKLPECTNPLALHIMKVTSEYSSNPDLAGQDQEDGAEVNKKISKKTKKLKKFFGKRVHKIKSEARVNSKQRGDDGSSSSEEEGPQHPNTPYIKIKSAHGKGPVEFEKLKLLQDLSGVHEGAVWTIKFSVCGRIMATAGQDNIVRVWILKEFQEYFEEMRRKYSRDGEIAASPASEEEVNNTEDDPLQDTNTDNQEDDPGPFKKTPFCTYQGHTGDVLDLTWSKNYFLLSSSMDKTVRLWHISRNECLCCFQHIDFVTAIIFHPRDDRYFLSGSLDGKIRLWNIPDKKVALWNEIEGTGSSLITAANFVMNGKFAVVGTYDGRCIFYETERLKYHTQWQVRPSRNKKARGRKISGIEPMPGEEKVLITSNDSRIRLYDLKDNSLYCKYKGCANTSSQIKAGFSHDGQYIVCGSEDHFVYIWRTQHGIASSRRDKNDYFESFSAHEAVVTAAMFAPVPWLVVAPDAISDQVTSEVLVTADWTGAIKLFVNR